MGRVAPCEETIHLSHTTGYGRRWRGEGGRGQEEEDPVLFREGGVAVALVVVVMFVMLQTKRQPGPSVCEPRPRD